MADPRNLPYPPAPSGLELGYGVNPVTHQPPQYPAPASLGFAQQPPFPHPVAPAPVGQGMVPMGSTPIGTSGLAILSHVRIRQYHKFTAI